MSPYNGGAAFPRPFSQSASIAITSQEGMTLRDYFAGQFLTTVVIVGVTGALADEVANNCYIMADAMLKARLK